MEAEIPSFILFLVPLCAFAGPSEESELLAEAVLNTCYTMAVGRWGSLSHQCTKYQPIPTPYLQSSAM